MKANLHLIGKAFNRSIFEARPGYVADYMGTHEFSSTSLDLLQTFSRNQTCLTSDFLDFQSKLMCNLDSLPKKFKCFDYLFPLFEASPYKTQSVFQFLKLRIVLDFIEKNNIGAIYLHSLDRSIVEFFRANKKKLNVDFYEIDTVAKHVGLRNFIKKSPIFSLAFRLGKELSNIQIILPSEIPGKKVALSYFPGCEIKNGVVTSKYFGAVSKLFDKEYCWLFLSVGKDAKLRSERSLLERSAKNSQLSAPFFLDDFFAITDFLAVSFKFLKFRLGLPINLLSQIFFIEGINYFSLFKNDLDITLADETVKQLIYESKFHNFFRRSAIKEIIYPLEFQPWELSLNKEAKKFDLVTKAFTHSIVRPNLMNYYYPRSVYDLMPSPSFIGLNSPLLKKKFDFCGQKTITKSIEAHRFNYLAEAKPDSNAVEKNSILIVTSIDPKETENLLRLFSGSSLSFDAVYIKEHPSLPVQDIIERLSFFPDYVVAQGSISQAFKLSSLVLVANSSSVLLEAVITGKQVVTSFSLLTLPMPAVSDNNVTVVSSAREFDRFVLEARSSYPGKHISAPPLFLDKNLTFWQEFLDATGPNSV